MASRVAPLERRLAAYAEFGRLRKVKLRRDVVRIVSSDFGVTPETVYEWYKGTDPIGRRAGRVSRIPELLYVLGALLGDGCIYYWRGNYQVYLVGEKEFVLKYCSKLSNCIGKPVSPFKPRSKNVWVSEVGNAELFFLLKAIRKDTSVVESLAREIGGKRGLRELAEGLFDAEGCVKIIGGRPTPKVCLDFTNTDFRLVRLMKDALSSALGIEARVSEQEGIPPRKLTYHLRIYRKSDISKYLRKIGTVKLVAAKRDCVHSWLRKKRKGKGLVRDFPEP